MFIPNKAVLSSDKTTSMQLGILTSVLKGDPGINITLMPLTEDARGEISASYEGGSTDNLVQLRGEVMKKYLTDRGVEADRIDINTDDSFNKTYKVTVKISKIVTKH
jgi:hypothetical protein